MNMKVYYYIIIFFIVVFIIVFYIKNSFILPIIKFFDVNAVSITKTITLLNKTFNSNLTKEDIDSFEFKRCIFYNLIVEENNKYKLTSEGLQICFQYTNNKYIIFSVAFTTISLIVATISIYITLITKL